jgi:hypothetical protein
MDINQAKKIVVGYGDYFYDETDRFSIDEIVFHILGNILFTTSKAEAILLWEIDRDAFYKVAEELDVIELNTIICNKYNFYPEEVGDGKQFFRRMAEEMDECIQQVKQKFSDKE